MGSSSKGSALQSSFSDAKSFASNPFGVFGRKGGGGGNDIMGSGELDLEEFKRRLGEINPQFFEADFGAEKTRGIAELLERRGRGIEPRDPAFERFRESQFNIFEQGAEEQRQNVASNLARRGLGSSSTGINQLAGVDRNLGLRREALGAQIGMQELGRRDNALQQSLGAFGQSAAAQDMQLNARSAGLENLLAIPALQVSQQAAINAGKLPEEDEPGLIDRLLGGLY